MAAKYLKQLDYQRDIQSGREIIALAIYCIQKKLGKKLEDPTIQAAFEKLARLHSPRIGLPLIYPFSSNPDPTS